MRNIDINGLNINPTNDETAEELHQIMTDVIKKGIFPNNDVFEAWNIVNKFDDRQRLLVGFSVFPQYIGLGLVDYYKNKIQKK